MKKNKFVLSASRRTDIPAFYMDQFMDGIDKGFFSVENPFNRNIQVIAATPEDVHAIVFWSKDFGTFIRGGYGRDLKGMGYNLFFNYTINSEDLILEPRVPPLKKRLMQVEALTGLVPYEAITWRFDPVCFYRIGNSRLKDNLNDFERIADGVAECGITHCTTSFVDLYAKIKKRLRAIPGFIFEDPPQEKAIEVLTHMKEYLDDKGIELCTCCEKELLDKIQDTLYVKQGACISHERIIRVYGGSLSCKRDMGQRTKQGCGCMESKDIGSYQRHPCFHNCLFCYANPAAI